MRTQSMDTSPEAERVQIELIRKASPAKLFGLVRSLSRTMIQTSRDTIRRLHPDASEEELALIFLELYYGKELADRVRADLERRKGGSVASSIHGIPRLTIDADIVADLRLEHVRLLVKQLEPDYYIDADAVRDAIKRRSSFNAIHLDTMLKVDVFIPKTRPFDQEELRRVRQEVLVEGIRPFYTASPEGTILTKLEWYRLGGEVSDRQWNDILGVLKVQGTALDLAYLRHWAANLKVADLLERALMDAGLEEA